MDVWLNITNAVGASTQRAHVVNGRWSLEIVGGCGDADFTLAREWDDVADLVPQAQVTAFVDNEVWWRGILQQLEVSSRVPPVIRCVGHRERLRRLGKYHREWTTSDKNTATTNPTLDLDDDVAADVMSRMTGLCGLTGSRDLPSRNTSFASLDGDGYGVMDGLLELYGGEAIWGVDEQQTLYLKSLPTSVVTSNGHLFWGRDFSIAFRRDDTQILNNIVAQGAAMEFVNDLATYRSAQQHWLTAAAKQFPLAGVRLPPGPAMANNPAWNLLPNASFEERRADVPNEAITTGSGTDNNFYSWPGLKITTSQGASDTDACVGGTYSANAAPTKYGEANLKVTLDSTGQAAAVRINTAVGDAGTPNAGEDARVPVTAGMTFTLCAAVYCSNLGANVALLDWLVYTYNSTGGLVESLASATVTLQDGWNTWADGNIVAQGADTAKTFTLGGSAVEGALIVCRLSLNTLGVTQIFYFDGWQMQVGGSAKPFSPSMGYWQQYSTSGSTAASTQPSEVYNSVADYGWHSNWVGLNFKDVLYNVEADGIRQAHTIFLNRAVPKSTGTIEILKEAPFIKPWNGMVRLVGLPSAVETILKRFDSEDYVDLQAERVEYTWDGALRARVEFSNKWCLAPFTERGGTPPPRPETRTPWREFLERASRVGGGHVQRQWRERI